MPESTQPLYFAYGSNLDEADWLAFCTRQGAEARPLYFVSTAVLPDMTLAFDYDSTGRAGGVLDIIPRIGHVVHGVIFRPDAATWALLDAKEGAPHCYRRTARTAILPSGETVAVQTYEVVPARRQAHTPPDPAYLEVVRRGLARWKLPDRVLQRAANALPPVSEVSAIFAYGTLMRGESRALESFWPSVLTVSPGATPGRLLRTAGLYPAMRLPDVSGYGTVPSIAHRHVLGECYQVGSIEALLPEFDRIEGFRGHADTDSLFLRTIVDVTLADGSQRQCWCYIAGPHRALGGPIPSGDWRQHNATKRA